MLVEKATLKINLIKHIRFQPIKHNLPEDLDKKKPKKNLRFYPIKHNLKDVDYITRSTYSQ